jgi:thioredoxin 1
MKKKISFTDLIHSEIPILVDFSAEWCGPCKAMMPILQEVVSEMGDNAKVVKIDVDQNRAIAEKYQIRGVPTLMIFKNGEMLWRQSGMQSAHALISLLKQNVNEQSSTQN